MTATSSTSPTDMLERASRIAPRPSQDGGQAEWARYFAAQSMAAQHALRIGRSAMVDPDPRYLVLLARTAAAAALSINAATGEQARALSELHRTDNTSIDQVRNIFTHKRQALLLLSASRKNMTERFLAKVGAPTESGCRPWTGGRNNNGYGLFGGINGGRGAHRMSYMLFIGAIPAGLEVEHRCHTADPSCDGTHCPHRACVNPDHLELLTRRENTLRGRSFSAHEARQTHCLRDHPLSGPESKVRITSAGSRQCLACIAISDRERRLRRQAKDFTSPAQLPKVEVA